jgi:Spy/CpxP family protein refolding chaperone
VLTKKTLALTAAPAIALTLVVAGSAGARPPADDAERGERFAKRLERVEKMVRNKLAPKLEVDEATTDELVTIFQAELAQKHTAHQAVRTEMKKLKELVDEGAGSAALDAQLARVDAARDGMPTPGAALDQTAKILTSEQQAKLVLGAHKMMKRRHHKRRGMHMRGGHGEGRHGDGDGPRGGFGGPADE